MKSTTNQDFIDGNQDEGIKIQRKIRVKILDPDATDSSSDDEQEKRPKFIIHEIIQEKVNIQSFSQNNKDPFDFYQFSGKLPPIIGKLASEEKLEVVNNAKEAISAKSELVDVQTSDSSKVKTLSDQFYAMVRKRKCGKFATEFEEKLKVAKNVIVEKAISAKPDIGCSSSDPPLMVDTQTSDLSKVNTGFDQFFGKLPPMVRKRKTGKFSSEIRHPFSKKRIWLGTFDTPEEASEVYQSKKLEFEELKKARNAKLKKIISAIEAHELSEYKKFEKKKKLKKAKNANVKKVISAKFELGVSSSDPPLMVDSQSSDSSKVKIQSFSLDQVSGKLPPMVRKRKSGKFATEIKHPISKKRIWLGTFDTAEEASEVYQSKKLEFEKLKKVNNANVKKAISAKFVPESFSSDPPLMVHSQSSGSLNELDDQMRKAINANVKVVISAKSEFGYSSSCDLPVIVDSQTSNESDERLNMAINAKDQKAISAKSELVSSSSSDQPLVVDSQTSDSSNGQESEEEMWMGQWIRISGDKEVKFSQKLGVPVVDNYGFLLGEFSELDDLSISI